MSRSISPKKLAFYCLLFILLISSVFHCDQENSKRTVTRIEAEHASWLDLEKLDDALASGGNFLRMKDRGQVVWMVEIPDSGWYNLVFRYRAEGGEKEQIVLKNDVEIPTGFPISDRWNLLRRAVFLNAGENSIGLAKSWGYMDIDYLSVETVILCPELVPMNNQVYTKTPRDLSYKLNLYGRRLELVKMDGNIIQPVVQPYPFQEDAWRIFIPQTVLGNIAVGNHSLEFGFDSNEHLTSKLHVSDRPSPSPLTIVVPDVSHGSSVLILLPSGASMLVDCGQDWVRDQVIIPLLDRLGIRKLDYLMITHYHEDHDSRDRGETIRKRYDAGQFIDYHTWPSGTELPFEGTMLKILNSYEDGMDENTRSLSFRLSYDGFTYTHGGDTYGINQEKIMARFPNDLKTDVFHANHHFHGSVDVDYLRALDPKLVLIQAEQAIYARSAYMLSFREDTEPYLRQRGNRYIEDLPAVEVGSTVIRVRSGDDWTYETFWHIGEILLYLNF